MKNVMSQSESVVHFTKLIMMVNFRPGVPILEYITDQQKEYIVEAVAASIWEGDTELSPEARAKYNTPKLVRSYTVGLVNNWFRKHKELNGGGTYVPKNPGSRISDPQLKEMRALRKRLIDRNARPEDIARADAAIERKLKELGAKEVEINLDLLPDELKDLI